MSQPATPSAAVHRDGGSQVATVLAITPVVASTTQTGAAVDLKGYDGAVAQFVIGNSGDTLSGSVYITPSITTCDTEGGSYDTLSASAYRVDIGSMAVIDAPAEDTKVIQVTILNCKRYVKLVLTLTGTHTNGTPVAATVLKTHPRFAPAAA